MFIPQCACWGTNEVVLSLLYSCWLHNMQSLLLAVQPTASSTFLCLVYGFEASPEIKITTHKSMKNEKGYFSICASNVLTYIYKHLHVVKAHWIYETRAGYEAERWLTELQLISIQPLNNAKHHRFPSTVHHYRSVQKRSFAWSLWNEVQQKHKGTILFI